MADGYDFDRLDSLRKYLTAIRRTHVPTLKRYISQDKLGFCHQITKPEEASLASTSTCVASLVAAGQWYEIELSSTTKSVVETIIDKRKSAGLEDYNPFSMSFVAECVLDLLDVSDDYAGLEDHRSKVISEIGPLLAGYLRDGYGGALGEEGSISIEPYPPSAYLTELVFRVVKRCKLTDQEIDKRVHKWSRGEINKQVALITAGSRNGDPLQLSYALILAVTTVPEQKTTPEDKEIFSHALSLFFSTQKIDGTWPLSRPMFHYKAVGSAYAFEYEALTRILDCEQLQDELLNYIPQLELAAFNLRRTAFDLDPGNPGKIIAWASGHHPQLQGPESWSSASVYHFAYALDRLVAEAIRRSLFQELRLIYQGSPKLSEVPPADDNISEFAPKFLDAELRVDRDGKSESLRNALAKHFVYPIAREADLVRRGGQLSEGTPMSAILFGPPGTSKTELAKIAAGYLHWPLLPVDPSYVVQEGLDKVQAMANRLFGMLLAVEQVVVLLDEFDELGRDRAGNANLLSRFITTAMLPKLAAINKERKIVFLLATNYLSGFDAAFRRGGRFDMQLQVLQPTLEAKLSADDKIFPGWKARLGTALSLVRDGQASVVKSQLADLTFLETKKVVDELRDVDEPGRIVEIVGTAWKSCTLEKSNDTGPRAKDEHLGIQGPKLLRSPKSGVLVESGSSRPLPNWRTTSIDEASEIRLPPVIRSASS